MWPTWTRRKLFLLARISAILMKSMQLQLQNPIEDQEGSLMHPTQEIEKTGEEAEAEVKVKTENLSDLEKVLRAGNHQSIPLSHSCL